MNAVADERAPELALTIPADPRFLAMMRAVLAEAAAAAGFDAPTVERIVLAVGEAASNIIGHCYRGECKPIVMRCLPRPDGLEVRLRDYGEKPKLAELHGRDLAAVRPGGLGIHLMRQIMDEVVYDLSPEVGTELRMRKRLPGRSGS